MGRKRYSNGEGAKRRHNGAINPKIRRKLAECSAELRQMVNNGAGEDVIREAASLDNFRR